MCPPRQRLDARDLQRLQVDDRLIGHRELWRQRAFRLEGWKYAGIRQARTFDELTTIECAAQVCFKRHAVDEGRVHGSVEDDPSTGGAELRLVHGHIRVAQQFLRILVAGVERDAGACADGDATISAQFNRLPKGSDDSLHDGFGAAQRVHLLEQDAELVPAQSRHRVAAADGTEKSLTNYLQQAVARPVSLGIVDFLELIEIEDDDGDSLRIACAA